MGTLTALTVFFVLFFLVIRALGSLPAIFFLAVVCTLFKVACENEQREAEEAWRKQQEEAEREASAGTASYDGSAEPSHPLENPRTVDDIVYVDGEYVENENSEEWEEYEYESWHRRHDGYSGYAAGGRRYDEFNYDEYDEDFRGELDDEYGDDYEDAMEDMYDERR